METLVKTADGKYVWVDTRFLGDCWETGVFACNKEGKIESWDDLNVKRYPDYPAAAEGHAQMAAQWRLKSRTECQEYRLKRYGVH